jgi:hypothetical protein
MPVSECRDYKVGAQYKTTAPVKLLGEQAYTLFPSITRYRLDDGPYDDDDKRYYRRGGDLEIGTLLTVTSITKWYLHPEIGRHAMIDAKIDSGRFAGTQFFLDMLMYTLPTDLGKKHFLKRVR